MKAAVVVAVAISTMFCSSVMLAEGNTNTEQQFAQVVTERNGIRIIGDDIDVKRMSIKEAEELLGQKDIAKLYLHRDIDIIKNAKGEVVYVGHNLNEKDLARYKKRAMQEEREPHYQTYNSKASGVSNHDASIDRLRVQPSQVRVRQISPTETLAFNRTAAQDGEVEVLDLNESTEPKN